MKSFFLITPDNQIYELMPDKTLRIGRTRLNQIVLDDGGVSRLHAQVVASPEGPLLRDNDSANGTLVNGRLVKEIPLRHGDSIQISKFILCAFHGTRPEAEEWIQRRLGRTTNDQTVTDFTVQRPRPTDIVGDLATLNLINLLQTLVSQSQNGCLELSCNDQSIGRIFLTNGRIVNADTCDGLTGKEAFYQLATTAQGQFIFRAGANAPSLSILESPSALMLEACRLLDEKRASEPKP
jgi:hypothetical protein